MKNSLLVGTSMLALALLLVGCQADGNTKKEGEKIEILSSTLQNNNDKGEEKQTDEYNHEHDHEHEHSHDGVHEHNHDDEQKQIYKGFFEDNQVEHRELADWAGDWQSVYPYLLDGTLDEVFAHKANTTGKMTAEEYKTYYTIGYKTETERITINENGEVTFYTNGKPYTGNYESDGFEILTYEAGNRGVRYIFRLVEELKNMPKYLQFSDHHISPYKVDHYHLYWGDDRSALLSEVINWPTYYHSDLNGDSIAKEMMSH